MKRRYVCVFLNCLSNLNRIFRRYVVSILNMALTEQRTFRLTELKLK